MSCGNRGSNLCVLLWKDVLCQGENSTAHYTPETEDVTDMKEKSGFKNKKEN